MDKLKIIKYKVISKKIEAPLVATLEFSCSGLSEFIPGQFIDIYFPEFGSKQGKAYSLSSAPIEKKFCITVKAIGDFSNRLFDMKVGSVVFGSKPYGFFYSEEEDTCLVLIAGGIGIVPFRSMVLQYLKNNPRRRIFIFYSSRAERDIIFKKEFNSLEKIYQNLHFEYFITRQGKVSQKTSSAMVLGRIDFAKILKKINKSKEVYAKIENKEFLICGSISFVRDMRRGLLKEGIPESAIYTEAFFSH